MKSLQVNCRAVVAACSKHRESVQQMHLDGKSVSLQILVTP